MDGMVVIFKSMLLLSFAYLMAYPNGLPNGVAV